MSNKSILITGVIALLIMAGVFVYGLSRDTSPQALEHQKLAATPKPGSTPEVAPFACVPHCSDEQKHQAWDMYRMNPNYCTKAKDVPHTAMALRFSKVMDGEKVEIPLEREEGYECGENLYVW